MRSDTSRIVYSIGSGLVCQYEPDRTAPFRRERATLRTMGAGNQTSDQCVIMFGGERPLDWKRVIRGSMCLGLLLASASCGTSKANGTVSGTFRIMIGGVTYRTLNGRGYVIIRQGSRLVDKKVASSGRSFTISVPVGSYQITSQLPAVGTAVSPPGELPASWQHHDSCKRKNKAQSHVHGVHNCRVETDDSAHCPNPPAWRHDSPVDALLIGQVGTYPFGSGRGMSS